MRLRLDMAASLYLSEPGVQFSEPPGSSHIAPLAGEELTAHRALGDGALQGLHQRKASGCTAGEELGPVNADVAVGVPRLAQDHEVALEPEVTARVVRRIGYQHQVRQRCG